MLLSLRTDADEIPDAGVGERVLKVPERLIRCVEGFLSQRLFDLENVFGLFHRGNRRLQQPPAPGIGWELTGRWLIIARICLAREGSPCASAW